MADSKLYSNLLAEASAIRPDMPFEAIQGIQNHYIRAYAILIAPVTFRSQGLRTLAAGVNRPEAGELGRKVQDEVRASYEEQTPARVRAFERRRQAYVAEMDGLLFSEALAQGALDLLPATGAVTEAA